MNSALKRILCAALCAALLAGCVGAASAAGKKKTRTVVGELGDMMGDWYYVSSTVPEGWLYQQEQAVVFSVNDGSGVPEEAAETCEIRFKGGTKELEGALALRQDGDKWVVYVDNAALTVPGKAWFHMKAESENYLYERDFTLNVLDWNERPLLEVENEHPVVEAEIGQTITDGEIVSAVGKVNAEEISAKVLKLKTRAKTAADWFEPRSSTDVAVTGSGLRRVNSATVAGDAIDTVVDSYGSYEVTLVYRKGNIRAEFPVTILAEGFRIESDTTPVSGGKVRYYVSGTTEGKTFTWSVEGEGAQIDEATGVLTVDPDTPEGTLLTVTAAPDSDEAAVSAPACVYSAGLLKGVPMYRFLSVCGFRVPIPWAEDWSLQNGQYRNDIFVTQGPADKNGNAVYMDATWFDEETADGFGFYEDPEVAREEIAARLEYYARGKENVESEIIDLNGHPVGLETYTYYNEDGFYAHVGLLSTVRNTRELRIRVYSDNNRGDESAAVRVTLNDMEYLACMLDYYPARAPFTRDDAAISVSAKNEPEALTAGKTLQFAAAFANPQKVNKAKKNDAVSWSVADTETGEEVPGVTISDKGLLKIDRTLAAPAGITVKAASALFGTEGTYSLTAVPVVKAVKVEPSGLTFYAGEERTENVTVTLDPDTMDPIGLKWTLPKTAILELTETGTGTYEVKPLSAGTATLTVTEPGGRAARLTVKILVPVESVTLTTKGTPKPGAEVNINAVVRPNNAASRKVEWSLDVGEDIATVNAYGRVKIKKDVPAGTKITVTCTAPGAAVPVVSTVELEVQ